MGCFKNFMEIPFRLDRYNNMYSLTACCLGKRVVAVIFQVRFKVKSYIHYIFKIEFFRRVKVKYHIIRFIKIRFL